MLIKPENNRFHTITQMEYLLGVLVHLGAGFVFLWMNVYQMVWFNFILSVPIFLVSFAINRRGYQGLAFLLAFFELLFHQVAGVYFLGWDSGFQYFLIYLAGLTFFNVRWNTKVRTFLISIVFFSFISLYMFFRVSNVYYLSDFQHNFFYLSNSLSTLLGLVILINYYVQAANKAEKNLRSMNQNLSDKHEQVQKNLAERNDALECLDKELSEAGNYVRSILPQPVRTGNIRVDWRFIPSTSIGGDAFGYYWLDKDHFAMYLIDVSGHGVGAALLSVSVINTLRSQSLPHTDFKKPEMVLKALNKAFPGEENNHMFFTIWYGIYNKNTRELSYSSGGHPPALLLDNSNDQDNLNNKDRSNKPDRSNNKDDTVKLLRTPNFVIGGETEATYKNATQMISKNSKLYIFSDGVYEIKKPDGTMWRFTEFTKLVVGFEAENSTTTLDPLVEQIECVGLSKNFEDDFTIIEIVFE
jgi:sigma-B regulation protein RsbU (phosphoserine phosphatase)